MVSVFDLLNIPDDLCSFKWNAHLVKINDIFIGKRIPILLNEKDSRNKDVSYCTLLDENVEYKTLSNRGMKIELVKIEHEIFLDDLKEINAEFGIFNIGNRIIFIDKNNYFSIDRDIIVFKQIPQFLKEGYNDFNDKTNLAKYPPLGVGGDSSK